MCDTIATCLVREHAHGLVLVGDILSHADAKTARRSAYSDFGQRRAALETVADSSVRRSRWRRVRPKVRSRSKGVLVDELENV